MLNGISSFKASFVYNFTGIILLNFTNFIFSMFYTEVLLLQINVLLNKLTLTYIAK